MANFYKMDPVLWDHATADLSLEEEAAYLRICNAIYRSERGCPMNDRVLAGMFRASTRKARTLVDLLVARGKVYVRDGYLWNEKAERELGAIADKKEPKPPRTDRETVTNQERNANEVPAKVERISREPDAKAQRNGANSPDKSLKDAELFEGDRPPKTKTKTKTKIETKTETRLEKDSIEEAFARLWADYPRRLTESATLVKGSRQEAYTAFRALSPEERTQAIEGLPAYKRVYPDKSKAVCDCVRYFKYQRWRDVEGLAVAPPPGIVLPKNGLAPKIQRLIAIISLEKYRAWFEDGGHCLIEPRGEGALIKAVNGFSAVEIGKRFHEPLNSAFGYGNWQVKAPAENTRET